MKKVIFCSVCVFLIMLLGCTEHPQNNSLLEESVPTSEYLYQQNELQTSFEPDLIESNDEPHSNSFPEENDEYVYSGKGNPYGEPLSFEAEEIPKLPKDAIKTNHPEIEQGVFALAYRNACENGGYILPDSDRKILTTADPDFDLLSHNGLRILAKNEIYARHGRKFQNKDIQTYFNLFDWYEGKIEASEFDDSVLSAAELKNAKFLDNMMDYYDDNGRYLGQGTDYDIYENIVKKPGWRQIVQNSNFSLGDIRDVNNDPEWPWYAQEYGSYPIIDGSTVALNMIAEFSWQHLKDIPVSDENTRSFIDCSTTDIGYSHLIFKSPFGDGYYYSTAGEQIHLKDASPVNLFIGTEPSPEHLLDAKRNGVTLVKKPVCLDAFVFIVNKNNPVNSLTIEQIQKIYSGEITNWKQVGGNDTAIKPYQRSAGSGSQTAMTTKVMNGKELMEPRRELLEGLMGGLVASIADYDNGAASIGYTYKYFIDYQYKNPDIKIIKVNGITPSEDNVRSKKYPFYDYYYGVIRNEDSNSTGGLFLDWMLSDEGQQCIKQAGYIPLSD